MNILEEIGWSIEEIEKARKYLWKKQQKGDLMSEEGRDWELFELRIDDDCIALVHRFHYDVDDEEFDTDKPDWYYMITWLYPSKRKGKFAVNNSDVISWSEDGQSPFYASDTIEYLKDKRTMLGKGNCIYVPANPNEELIIQTKVELTPEQEKGIAELEAYKEDYDAKTYMCDVCGKREGGFSISSNTICWEHTSLTVFHDPLNRKEPEHNSVATYLPTPLPKENCFNCGEPLSAHWDKYYDGIEGYKGGAVPNYKLTPDGKKFGRCCEYETRHHTEKVFKNVYGHRCKVCEGKGYNRSESLEKNTCISCNGTGFISLEMYNKTVEIINKVTPLIIDELKLESVPEFVLITDFDAKGYGRFLEDDFEIEIYYNLINEHFRDDFEKEVIRTIAHELRHVQQYLSNKEEYLLATKENAKNMDNEKYNEHSLEIDATNYAEKFTSRIN
jgi:hypothetical protein